MGADSRASISISVSVASQARIDGLDKALMVAGAEDSGPALSLCLWSYTSGGAYALSASTNAAGEDADSGNAAQYLASLAADGGSPAPAPQAAVSLVPALGREACGIDGAGKVSLLVAKQPAGMGQDAQAPATLNLLLSPV